MMASPRDLARKGLAHGHGRGAAALGRKGSSPKRGLLRRSTHNFRSGQSVSHSPSDSTRPLQKSLPSSSSSLYPHPSRDSSPVNPPSTIMSTAELACSYAALILADDGLEVSVRIHP